MLVVDADQSPPIPCRVDRHGPNPNGPSVERAVDIVSRPARSGPGAGPAAGAGPVLDGSGLMYFGGRRVTLSLTEERVAVPLVRAFRHVVSNEALEVAGWPAGAPSENGRRLLMRRLRQRCAPLGLAVTSVRGRGYILSESSPAGGRRVVAGGGAPVGVGANRAAE
jgi:hypothetical protein